MKAAPLSSSHLSFHSWGSFPLSHYLYGTLEFHLIKSSFARNYSISSFFTPRILYLASIHGLLSKILSWYSGSFWWWLGISGSMSAPIRSMVFPSIYFLLSRHSNSSLRNYSNSFHIDFWSLESFLSAFTCFSHSLLGSFFLSFYLGLGLLPDSDCEQG